ncbi:hypothetical protein B0H10DRAFT_1774916 [Mycena sp. CBHHK59/15]|nr:hypothetical protein B0H10DRAFT_1774916 [Mycena sp. CBHHK59/15]
MQTLVTPAHTIQPSESAKYLGHIMDLQLRWKEQVQQAVAKGTKAIMAVNRLTRPTFGLPHQFVRQLYRSVIIPKMEYGLCVWYSPVIPTARNAARARWVQNVACRLITGAFKTNLLTHSAISRTSPHRAPPNQAYSTRPCASPPSPLITPPTCCVAMFSSLLLCHVYASIGVLTVQGAPL